MAARHDKARKTRTERTRQQIIQASKPLFDEQSPHDLTYRAVAIAARSTPRTIQHYFPSLSALAIEAYAEHISAFRKRLQKRDERGTNLLATLTFELAVLFIQRPSLAASFLDEAAKEVDDQHPVYQGMIVRLHGRIETFRGIDARPAAEPYQQACGYLQRVIR